MKNFILSISILTVILALGSRSVAQPAPGGVAPVITEIMYNPPEAGNDSLEFLEVFNPSLTASINMGGYYFTGVNYTFPAGFSLGPNQYVLVSGDSVIFQAVFGVQSFEWVGATTQLSNNGEGLALKTPSGVTADTVFYGTTNAWPANANGLGYSLVLCNPTSNNNLPASWTASENNTGIVINGITIYADPGAASTCTATGIEDDNVITTLVYPNPTEGVFSINYASLDKSAVLSVHNSLGQLIHTQALNVGSTNAMVDLALKTGYYIVSFEKDASVERHSLMVR